jgi:5-methylcytosine-specific restriction enzyme B
MEGKENAMTENSAVGASEVSLDSKEQIAEVEFSPTIEKPAVKMPKERINSLLRPLVEILSGFGGPVHWEKVIDELQRRKPPQGSELDVYKRGQTRYVTGVRWYSVGLVKAGWMLKDKAGGTGIWSITEAGKQALVDYPDDQSFGQRVSELYAEAMAKQRSERELSALLTLIPSGHWTSLVDVAEKTGQDPQVIGKYLWQSEPSGWYRVLSLDGKATAENYPGYPDPEMRVARQRELLREEHIDALEGAPEDCRLTVADLSTLAASAGKRAWLVRCSDVAGQESVSAWLDEGFVSRPATNIVAISQPVTRPKVEKAVNAALPGRASDYRRRRVEEYDRFLRRMVVGDLVMTVSEGFMYIGEVMSDPQWVADESTHAKVRREVAWFDEGEGFATRGLPAPLPTRLTTPDDVADMTLDYDVIAGLISVEELDGGIDGEGDVETAIEGVTSPRIAELRSPTQELADELFIPLAWLESLTRLLQRRNQVILYGPPGTGKTYVATQLAEHFTEANNVRVVQFHPSYTYEDFIAGYRPTEKDGNVVFQLRQGPLMQMAEQARDNPGTAYVLIIDEINRANLAKVFGELYFLLEYRDRAIELLYSEDATESFSLPTNLFIIGTMNTADRSIALVDAAMRRRFAFRELHPDKEPVVGVLPRWLEANNPEFLAPAGVLQLLNERLNIRDYAIGPSYFMKEWLIGNKQLEEVWETDILPLLEEHHAGEGLDVAAHYDLKQFLSQIGGDGAGAPENSDTSDSSSAGDGGDAVDETAEPIDDGKAASVSNED